VARHLTLLGPSDDPSGPDRPASVLTGAIVHVAATRADATALAAVVPAVRRRTTVAQVLVYAGPGSCAEWDLEELTGSVEALRRLPLDVEVGSHAVQTASALTGGEAYLADLEPSVVVVPGSTNVALGCALAAAKLGVPVARIDAGVREHDWQASQEVNRVLIDTMADILFAPTREAGADLAAEGVQDSRVHVVGSTTVAAAVAGARAAIRRRAWAAHGPARGEYVYATLARPANVEHDERLARIVEAVAALAQRAPVILSLQPAALERLRPMGDEHRLCQAGVVSLPPLGYADHLSLLAGAGAVVTDAGSAQEEASALGVPCFTLGATTEHPMTLVHGTNTLLGADPRDLDAVRLAAKPADAGLFARWHAGAGERVAEELVANYALVRATSAS
jgi:UDP-N-acetylglucosamine 2-epimerase (non-hydrolysing)